MLPRIAVVSLLLMARALAQHQVLVVDDAPGPGVDFTSLQAAVDAADPGDTVLVRDGTYAPFTIVDKSLTITADAGAVVKVESYTASSQVIGLEPDGFLTISGLQLRSKADDLPGLSVEDCAGGVWLDGCLLSGISSFPSLFKDLPTQGLHVSNSSSVVLDGCTLYGGSGLFGTYALLAENSVVHLYATSCTGGSGQCDGDFMPTCGDGGTAVALKGGLLTAQSSTLTGGVPSPGYQLCIPFCLCQILSKSGKALSLLDGSPQAFLFDTALSVGPPHPPCGVPASSATTVTSGTLDEATGTPFAVTTASPQRVGDPASLDFAGAPGDAAIALLAIFPLDVWLPKFHGPWLVGGNFQILVLGSVPAGGVLSLPYVVPPLPPGFESVEFIVQAARTSSEGTLLANPARVVLLAPGF